jgi:hypothetical protein
MLGGRFAFEAVRSGASVKIWDFDQGSPENAGTQLVESGVAKVTTVAGRCNEIRPGSAAGWQVDIRHAGIRPLMDCSVLVDCTDDPNLAWELTDVSNGLGIPLLRCALDGSGKREFGRVLCSAGSVERACQICSYSADDLGSHVRDACPGVATAERPPTLAGGAMAAAIAGLGLLQAQRLVTGHEIDRVLEREILIDWDEFQTIPLRLERSPGCLSGHVRWNLLDLDAAASDLSVADLLELSRRQLSDPHVSVSFYLHPLNTQAVCDCGASTPAVGTDWATPPACPKCGAIMRWLPLAQVPSFDSAAAGKLGILDRSLTDLGIPERGAMLTARAPARHPVRMLLSS